jgi:hypothetical protein
MVHVRSLSSSACGRRALSVHSPLLTVPYSMGAPRPTACLRPPFERRPLHAGTTPTWGRLELSRFNLGPVYPLGLHRAVLPSSSGRLQDTLHLLLYLPYYQYSRFFTCLWLLMPSYSPHVLRLYEQLWFWHVLPLWSFQLVTDGLFHLALLSLLHRFIVQLSARAGEVMDSRYHWRWRR